MNRFLLIYQALLLVVILCSAGTSEAARALPVIDGKEAVATVNGKPISLEEFNQELATLHQKMGEEEDTGGRVQYARVLRNMINVRIIEQEARNIGLDKLSEVKNQVDLYAEDMVIKLLFTEFAKDVKADDETVDQLYKDAVREYRMTNVIFKTEDHAKTMEQEIQTGKDFDGLAASLAEKGKVVRIEEGEFSKVPDFLPMISGIVAGMEVGSVSPVIKVGEEFVIFKIKDVRYPENAEAMEWARKTSQKKNKNKAVEEYVVSLRKKYAKENDELLNSIDFETGMEDFRKLLKDERILTEVEGEKPITVAELAQTLKEKHYHGVENAIRNKELNAEKADVLAALLKRQLTRREALAQGLDKREYYTKELRGYERGILFDSYIRKMIVPGIELTRADIQDYYDRHIEEYTNPEMVRIRGLAFQDEKSGSGAFEKLQQGSDFQWLSNTAEGQVEKDAEGLLNFQDKMLLTISGLPEGVRAALANPRAGDSRLYVSPEKYTYVLSILEVVPKNSKPIEKVWDEIKDKVFRNKLNEEIDTVCQRLRKYYPVKIYGEKLKK